jgi:hypothetical protein
VAQNLLLYHFKKEGGQMSVPELVALIFSLCASNSDKLACFDEYNNCAVTYNGKILTKEQFNEKCRK